jgi:hypothetical protein
VQRYRGHPSSLSPYFVASMRVRYAPIGSLLPISESSPGRRYQTRTALKQGIHTTAFPLEMVRLATLATAERRFSIRKLP